ncbi:P-loop NTPase fold protein [Roseovarius nitratireducens]|uniref:P-loop NTPase fold protein n=1 Tax=Roseovarius nitratireducens TaxID=2044597 RepID=UPI00101AD667|nr:P-loop NTPase fold protein [Roseovarius nitratireducens]
MDQNTAAISALHEYTNIKEPKYAFMIEAPWGAGKTHLVKHEFKDAVNKGNARYVTLNGVKDQKTFRRALLAETSDAKIADAVGMLGSTLGFFAKYGNAGSIVQDAVEDRMVSNLPDLLIFDDVERCEMSPAEVLGLLNEFVEHKSKNVVLCGFIEQDKDIDKETSKPELFLTLKEKVVGRTVRIVADVDKALPDFINSMPDGHGKQWFQFNHDLVLDVFASAEHGNLRVLRQCIHDCGRVIDVLEEDLRTSTDSMHRFVRTYLVLSMALATASMSSQHLSERDNPKCVVKPAEGEKQHPLYACFKKHPKAEIFAGNSASILPIDLGVSLIGIGFEEPEKINSALRATKQFSGESEPPLWRRFVEWRLMPSDELARTHSAVVSHIFEDEEIEPGPYLHMAHDLIAIAEDGDGSGAETAKKIKERIKALSEMGKIPAARYGREYGWSFERGFSFGGYAFDPDELNKPVVDAMKNVQLAAFEVSKADEAKRLLGLLVDDLGEFEREFSGRVGQGGYYRTEILHVIDPRKFAEGIFGYVTSGEFDVIGALMKTLADRHRNANNSFAQEAAWVKTLKASLVEVATDAGPIEKARMHWFLKFNWTFPEGDENGA